MGVPSLIWYSVIFGACYLVAAEQDNDVRANDNEISRKPYTNKTIARVESILARNTTLPRLTRGEILEILENITKMDESRMRSSRLNGSKGNDESKNGTREEKSLLVVLPFNPSNDTRSGLEVLYTKEPMTRLVFEGTTPSYSGQGEDNSTTPSTSTTTVTPRPHKRRRKPMKPIVVVPQQEQRPVYVHNTRTSTTTQPPIESSSEDQWKPYTAYDSAAVVTRRPPDVEIPLPESMKTTFNHLNLPKNHKPDGQAVYVTLPDATTAATTTTKRPWKKPNKPKFTASTTSKPRTTTKEPMPDISGAMESLTPEMKNMLANLGLVPGRSDGGMTQPPLMPVDPPEPVRFRPINPTVDVSSYMSFKPLPVKGKADGNPMDKDMKQILSNFGLIAPERQPVNYYGRMQKSLDVDEDDAAATLYPGNRDNKTSSYAEVRKKTMTLTDINTDVLSDEMKDMLEDLGVIRNSKRRGSKGHIFNPVTQSALLDKPDHAERITKVLVDIKKLSEDNTTRNLHPDEIKAHLDNITSVVFTDGDNTSKEDDLSFSQSENEADDDTDRGIVFGANGHFDGYEPDEEELLRIQGVQGNQFPGSIDNNFNLNWNATAKDGYMSTKLKEIPSPPDPLSLEELHHAIEAVNKNEVKRQQPENSTEPPTTVSSDTDTTVLPEETSTASSETTSSPSTEAASSAPSEQTTTSTTTEPQPNIKDLEDSFGGETPLVRPNGLYFLLDWNSFLRVGQDNRTVNLQFSPKVGDPRNFIPVNVP